MSITALQSLPQSLSPTRRVLSRNYYRTELVAGNRRAVVAGGVGLLVGIGLTATGAVAAAVIANSGADKRGAYEATRKGMSLFSQGQVAESLVEFDRALVLDASQQPYLWQRGLTLYYLHRFEEGAKQFRDDVAVNPNDTEEAIWAFLCEAQLSTSEQARSNFLQVGTDPRPVMRAAYELFQTGQGTEKLEEMAKREPDSHDEFYARLYLGLFYESKREEARAKSFIISAVNSLYGRRSGDYMARLAKVHCNCRGWI